MRLMFFKYAAPSRMLEPTEFNQRSVAALTSAIAASIPDDIEAEIITSETMSANELIAKVKQYVGTASPVDHDNLEL